jgi:hypothetical protein
MTPRSVLIVGCASVLLSCTSPPIAPVVAAPSTTTPDTVKCHARHVNTTDPQAWEPDPTCTPGSVEGGIPPDQICPVAHTTRVRPPASYTDRLKEQQMEEYGFTDPTTNYEQDHLIPLSLGGSPRDPANEWPEPHPSPNEKDRVEDAAHTAVCAGRMTLTDAQHKISTDWYRLGRDLRVIP